MNRIKQIKSMSGSGIKEKLKRIKKTFHNIPVINGKDDYPYSVLTLTDFNPPMDPWLIEDMADLIVYYGNFENVDLLVSEADRGGGPLTHAIALRTAIPYTLANWYPVKSAGSINVLASTGFGGKGWICLYGVKKGQKIFLIDDIISSGGTALALIECIIRAKAVVTEAFFVGEKITMAGALKIKKKYNIPVRSLVKFEAMGKSTKAL